MLYLQGPQSAQATEHQHGDEEEEQSHAADEKHEGGGGRREGSGQAGEEARGGAGRGVGIDGVHDLHIQTFIQLFMKHFFNYETFETYIVSVGMGGVDDLHISMRLFIFSFYYRQI